MTVYAPEYDRFPVHDRNMNPPPKRCWLEFTFSLRTMLVVLTVCCVL